MYRDGGGFTAYVIPEWATICHPRMGHNMSSPRGPQYVIPECTTICHPRMGHNMSSPNGPQYVILEWATICHPRMYLSGIQYHRHSGMGLAGIQENVIPMSVSEEESIVFSINHELFLKH